MKERFTQVCYSREGTKRDIQISERRFLIFGIGRSENQSGGIENGDDEKTGCNTVAKTDDFCSYYGTLRNGYPVYRTDSEFSGGGCGVFRGIFSVHSAGAEHAV